MNVLIIEDEERAANRLEMLLKEVEQQVNQIHKAASIDEAISFLQNPNPVQLILSDIQLEDGLSFEIFEQVDVKCPIIFTTAYDQYAIEAFRTNGIDYLLKPIDAERLRQALDKMKKLSPALSLDNLMTLANSALNKKQQYKTRFMIKVGERIKSIGVEAIQLFFSQDNCTFLLTNEGRNYPVDYSLDHLESLLNPEQFFRINRKFLLSINACQDIVAWSNSRLKIQIDELKNEMIVVARERVQDFKGWLDR